MAHHMRLPALIVLLLRQRLRVSLNQLVLIPPAVRQVCAILEMTCFFVINIILIRPSTLKVVCTVTIHQTRDIKVLAVKPLTDLTPSNSRNNSNLSNNSNNNNPATRRTTTR